MAFPNGDLIATIEMTVYAAVMITAALIMLFMAVYSWKYRNDRSSKPFILLMLLSAGWSISSSLLMLSSDESVKLVLQLAQYSCSIMMPVMALMTVIYYIEPFHRPSARLFILIFVVPISNIILMMTNEYHHLFFTDYSFVTNNGSSVLVNELGPVSFSSAIYSYSLIIISVTLLIRHMIQVKGIYRRRDIMVAVGIAVPFIGDAMLLFGVTSGSGISFAPILLIFMGVTLMFAMFRYHLFDVTPIAMAAVWDSTPDPSFLIDSSGKVIDANQAACDILGSKIASIQGANAKELFSSEPGLIGLLSMTSPSNVEIVIGPDDSQKHFEVQLTTMKDATGESMGMLLFMHNITDHKRLEQAIHNRAEGYLSLLDSIPFPLALIKKDSGSFVYLNSEMERTLRGEHDQLLKTTVMDHLVSPKDIEELLDRLTREGAVSDFETLVKNSEGSMFWAFLAAKPVTLNDQEHLLLLIRDISDRKMAESLNTANKKLSLISGITRHDLLNKFTVVGSYIQMLEGIEDKERQREIFRKLEMNNEAILELIDFARDYEQLGVKAPAWQEVETVFRRAAGQLDLTGIYIRTDARLLNVFADTMLEKVFYNMLDNSLRHGGRVGKISLNYSLESDGTAHMIYEDDGEGISLEDKKNLFKQGMGRHTGQGMFLTKEILQITGISIEEDGEPGHGVRFHIVVPKGMFFFKDENVVD